MPTDGTEDGSEQQEESEQFSFTRRSALAGVGSAALVSGLRPMLGNRSDKTETKPKGNTQSATRGNGSLSINLEAGIDEVLPGDKLD